jgi:hypothetical protein
LVFYGDGGSFFFLTVSVVIVSVADGVVVWDA